MILALPSFSPSFFVRNIGAATVFRSLGPLARGVIVVRFYCAVDLNATAAVTLGAAIGTSSRADLGSFVAGTTVLTASTRVANGKPVWDFSAEAARVVTVEAFMGVRIEGSTGHVIVQAISTAGNATFSGGLEVVRLTEVGVAAAGETLRVAVP